ncbi:MAG: 2-oxoacid:acceptor oxidoreductase subunit alpha [Candidatus Cloacimonetes bacterium HGW-Cloacimonetes-1]|nr:MAG: 2-oxoacid:acceptor oxidoreductase subunit alpha [Candidatus Cloacimonetes bacterium HGW-Cloacimonetes-1]
MDTMFTVLIAGKAGEGIKKAAQVIADMLKFYGRFTFQLDDYESTIRGGHNFSVVTTDTSEVYSVYNSADLIICFDKRSYHLHSDKLNPNGLLVYNSDEGSFERGIGIPLTSLMKDVYNQPYNVSVSAVAISAARIGMTGSNLKDIIAHSYKRDATQNCIYASRVYDSLGEVAIDFPKLPCHSGHIFSGNQLIALGAWTAGLDYYFSYPMTPASSILHYLAAKQNTLGVHTIHAESELAAINMAIGAVYCGCRTAVGSSGGGFALMQEAFSMAGMVEAPLLCILSSRPGPATGVSTYTAQEDLYFALHQGHGDFSRIVASPDCMERAYTLAGELLAMAWKFQLPVILLTEKHLSESMMQAIIDPTQVMEANHLAATDEAEYNRYEITDNGISPLLFPPSEAVIKWNSHEHLSSGVRTDEAIDIVAMKDKRNRKDTGIIASLKEFQTWAVYGEGDVIVFAYGSTVLELREALKHLDSRITILAPIYLEPFDIKTVEMFQNRRTIIVEHNSKGDFAFLIRSKLQIDFIGSILRYDGRVFDPLELAQRIEVMINAQA